MPTNLRARRSSACAAAMKARRMCRMRHACRKPRGPSSQLPLRLHRLRPYRPRPWFGRCRRRLRFPQVQLRGRCRRPRRQIRLTRLPSIRTGRRRLRTFRRRLRALPSICVLKQPMPCRIPATLPKMCCRRRSRCSTRSCRNNLHDEHSRSWPRSGCVGALAFFESSESVVAFARS